MMKPFRYVARVSYLAAEPRSILGGVRIVRKEEERGCYAGSPDEAKRALREVLEASGKFGIVFLQNNTAIQPAFNPVADAELATMAEQRDEARKQNADLLERLDRSMALSNNLSRELALTRQNDANKAQLLAEAHQKISDHLSHVAKMQERLSQMSQTVTDLKKEIERLNERLKRREGQ